MTNIGKIIHKYLGFKPVDKGFENWQELAHQVELEILKEVKKQAIQFAESIEWAKYEKFDRQENLWYDKKSTWSNPILAKTTEQLWREYMAKTIRENLTK